MSAPPVTLPLDHLGFATPSLATSTGLFAALLGATPEGEPVLDAHQRARIAFLRGPGGLRVELIEPVAAASPVYRMARAGGGLHHWCVQVGALDDFAAWCRQAGVQPVAPPVLAPAMGPQRHVAFAFAQGLGLVEFAQTPGAPALEGAVLPGHWREQATAATLALARVG